MVSDISMCNSKDCPLKETCFRFLAIPSLVYQSYADFKYENGNCEYYLKEETK